MKLLAELKGAGRVSLGISLLLAGSLWAAPPRVGVSVSEKAADNSPEAEKATFSLAEGYEVNLFASEEDGIANPISIRWDPQGRLWVLTTLAYAQLEPGLVPDDQLLILEDTDGDGVADTSEVWADGLNMPTGFALGVHPRTGQEGVFLAEGPDLVFIWDSDGNGQADQKELLLTGFGTGDTHQNINSLTWGPAGDLWFTQGLHSMARVETPWGIVRGEKAGFYRLRVDELLLEPFCFPSMASQNPWGMAFGKWGELFVKSNNMEFSYVTPGLIPTTHSRDLMRLRPLAVTPGKSMGGEIVESSHLPELENHVLIAGYFANRVTAWPLEEEASGFARVEGQNLLVAGHTSFRPVEVKIGPDGAIYVADWFNPIIGHYQASLRHPDRDVAHGRIWRITRSGQPLAEAPDLTEASVDELIQHLNSPERWVRDQAKRLLMESPEAGERLAEGETIVLRGPHHHFEFLGLLEGHDLIEDRTIATAMGSTEPKVRAYAAAIIGRRADSLGHPLSLLRTAIRDPEPRVRLEAVVAASHQKDPEAMSIALEAIDQPMDPWIDYALDQTVHALEDQWLPALQSGALRLKSPLHLARLVGTHAGPESVAVVQEALQTAEGEDRRDMLLVLARAGDASGLESVLRERPDDLEVLHSLKEAWQVRRVKPSGNLNALLQPALRHDNPDVQAEAIRLAGYWKVGGMAAAARDLILRASTPQLIRHTALQALPQIQGKAAEDLLMEWTDASKNRITRRVAAEALVSVNPARAAVPAAALLSTTDSSEEAAALLSPWLSRKVGMQILTEKLASLELDSEVANHISRALSSVGRMEPELNQLLNERMGIESQALEYSAGFVVTLAAEVRGAGNPEKGREVYESPLLNCMACHQIGDEGGGGILGPPLTTVGSGLPLDLLIESVLWPGRQLKEGYFSIMVTTKDGQVFNGYREREEQDVLWLKDIASGSTVPIQKSNIASRQDVGTLMPAGLTDSLSRDELRDLIAYLTSLRG